MTTASGQAAPDNAGDEGGLAKAFEAAVESVNLGETDFHEAAGEPSVKPTEQPVEDATEHAAEAESGGEEKETEGEAAQASQEPTVAAPAHWDAQRREAFGKLPPAGQKIVLDTVKALEGDFTRSRQELADKARFADNIQSLLTDEHRRQMRESGMDEAGGVSYLLRLNDYARAKPNEYARWFFGTTRLDPRQVFPEYFAGNGQAPQPPPQGQAQRGPDPNQQLYSAINPLIAQVNGLVQERHNERLQTADQAIAAFREAKSQDGQPVHPHMATVEQGMLRWLQQPALQQIQNFEARLQRAYDLAVNEDPQLRTQAIDAEVQRRLTAQRKAADVNKAKTARAPIRAQPNSPVTVKPKGLSAALDRAFGEVGV